MRILLPNPFHISLLFTKTLVWFASFSYRFSYIIPSSLRRNQCRRRVRITLIEVAYGKTFSSSPETPIFHRSSRGTWERSLFSLASRQCLFVAVPSDDSEISFCLAYQARLCQRWHSGEYRGPRRSDHMLSFLLPVPAHVHPTYIPFQPTLSGKRVS